MLTIEDRNKLRLYLSFEIGGWLSPRPEYERELGRLTQLAPTSLPDDIATKMADAALDELIRTIEALNRLNSLKP